MKLVEMFRSIQGEGNSQGANSLFIRFPNCNLQCSFCDSKFSWQKDQLQLKDFSDIEIDIEIEHSTNNVVFTGGEPLLLKNQKFILTKLSRYYDYKINFEIETNGTLKLLPEWEYFCSFNNIQFNISPKGNIPQDKSIKTILILLDQLKTFKITPNYIVKFLFENEKDFVYINYIIDKYDIPINKVWVQPIGISSKELKKTTLKYFNKIIDNGWNISLRSHVFLFENKKGV